MSAFSGYGTTIEIKISNTYTAIGQVSKIGGPAMQADTIDVSDLNTVWKQYIPGQIDGGELSLDIFLDPSNTTHVELRNALLNRQLRDFRITYSQPNPDVTASFSAYVTGYEINASANEALTASVTLRVTGEVVWANAT